MVYRYIPILRWKRGEKRGIKSVPAASAKDVCPLIGVTPETFADQPETISREAVPAWRVFADDIYNHWGARPFYLDASGIEPSARGVHPLIATAKACREDHATLIPAITLDAPTPYEAAVLQVAHEDKRGVALKVKLREFTSATQWLPNWPHALNETDLILDLADQVGTIAELGSSLDSAFRNVHRAKEWRTITVAGTSMLENFKGYDQGTFTIERAEYTLWQHLLSLRLPYQLDYGDYATVTIKPPPEKVRWGFPINVRYTLQTQFLICRGVSTTGEGAKEMGEQLIAHAKSIRRYPKRARLNCWSDSTIDDIAAEKEKPGGLEDWVKIAINRHIERVRADLP